MAVSSGAVSVGASAVKICTMGPSGALVQNLGAVVVTLGGPGVVAGQGPALAASQADPVFVPASGIDYGASDSSDVTDDLYGVGASAGPASVAFLTNV